MIITEEMQSTPSARAAIAPRAMEEGAASLRIRRAGGAALEPEDEVHDLGGSREPGAREQVASGDGGDADGAVQVREGGAAKVAQVRCLLHER